MRAIVQMVARLKGNAGMLESLHDRLNCLDKQTSPPPKKQSR